MRKTDESAHRFVDPSAPHKQIGLREFVSNCLNRHAGRDSLRTARLEGDLNILSGQHETRQERNPKGEAPKEQRPSQRGFEW